MREQKFRVWDIERECYLDETELAGITPDGKYVLYIEENEISRLEIEGDYIVEFSTGLRDKNGKEIYEGYIVDVSSVFTSPKHMLVKFDERSCGFVPFVNGCGDCYFPSGHDVEVIGNIHENPELLREGNDELP